MVGAGCMGRVEKKHEEAVYFFFSAEEVVNNNNKKKGRIHKTNFSESYVAMFQRKFIYDCS